MSKCTPVFSWIIGFFDSSWVNTQNQNAQVLGRPLGRLGQGPHTVSHRGLVLLGGARRGGAASPKSDAVSLGLCPEDPRGGGGGSASPRLPFLLPWQRSATPLLVLTHHLNILSCDVSVQPGLP